MGKSLFEELDPLFNPKSVAVVGATNNWNKWGYSTFTSAKECFPGEVYPVNSKEAEVLGRKAFPRVTDIPGPVDLVVFVIPAERCASVMEDCVAKGVKAAVIISAGFAEIGEEGKKLQDEVLRIARKGGIRFIGPNCMGFWSASSDLRAFMFPLPVMDGPLAFVSQGGNVGGALVVSGYARRMGFHRYVSCGAAADIQIEDYIEYFGEDPEVKVILAYIE
jgi:acyl-CoA synthetase (NDP forming)